MLDVLYKYSGLVAFVLTWFAVFYVLYRSPREFDKSISHHAAKNTKKYIVFAVLISLALFFLSIFAFLWLAPHLSLNGYLVALFAIAIVMELLTTWIPLTEGRTYHMHNLLSYGTALLLPIIVLGIILTSSLGFEALFMAYGGAIVMTGLLIVFFTVPAAHKKYLVYQSVYIAAFQLAIVTMPFSLA